MVHEVESVEDFKEQLEKAGDKLVVVDFFATWCGPCKVIAPKLVMFSEELPSVVFLKVDVDKNEDIASEYNINSMPTFVFIKNGKKLDEFSGANEEKLKKMIDQLK